MESHVPMQIHVAVHVAMDMARIIATVVMIPMAAVIPLRCPIVVTGMTAAIMVARRGDDRTRQQCHGQCGD
jgi:hypothetical protein